MTGPVVSQREPRPHTLADQDAAAPTVSGAAAVPTSRRHDHNRNHETTGGVRADIARAGTAVTMISLDGAVDLAGAHVLAAAVAGAVSAGGAGGRVVVELNRVTFLGSAGLGVLLAAHGDAPRRGGVVVLVVDEVAPAAATLRVVPPGRGPDIYSTLTAALHDGGEISEISEAGEVPA